MTSNNGERVTGSSKMSILNQIRKDTTTIQLVVVGTNYERLTLIMDMREEGGKSYVVVDCPDGFVEDVPNHENADIKIEFLGKDHIQYFFLSRLTRVSERNIWLEMPEYLVRVQRRSFFRIAPPIGTKITFSRIEKAQDASLINLSEGGALVTLNEPARATSRLVPDESLGNLRLRCRAENLNVDIRIGKATVVRAQAEHGKEKASYALKFLEMDPRDRRLLQEFIFMCQREILRKSKE